MKALFVTLVILVVSLVLLNLKGAMAGRAQRRRGKLPGKGKATMFDVRHLLMEGERGLAIQLYCEIFNTTQAKAKKDVDELARSLKV